MIKALFIVIMANLFVSKTSGQTIACSSKKATRYYYIYNDDLQNRHENFKAGYIDTFSMYGNRFRVLLADEALCVEYLRNKRWTTNFDFDFTGAYYDYSKDINMDGYLDFSSEHRWTYNVHLYNPLTKRFSEHNCSINEETALIDSNRKIFCDFQPYNYSDNIILSDLYIFQNGGKKIVFELKFERYYNGSFYTYKNTAKLFKCISNGQQTNLKNVVFDKSIEGKEAGYFRFDYVSYWTKNYKSLMDYH